LTQPVLKRWAPTWPGPVACCLCRSLVGAPHLGVLLRAGPARGSVVLHMAWHLREHSVALPSADQWWYVDPGLDPVEQARLALSAQLVRDRLEAGRLPFGLGIEVGFARSSGAPLLNGAAGFNCVSFVRALFACARVNLMHAPTDADLDAARRAEDEAAQRALVDALRSNHPEQADLVEAEVGAPRVRPEEVAAASGEMTRPVPFAAARQAGEALAARLPR
jgi:hypothetical protein